MQFNEILDFYPNDAFMNYTVSGDLNFTLTYLEGGNIVVDIPNNDLITLSCDLSDPNFVNLKNSTD